MLGQRLRQFFDWFDRLISPTMPIPANPARNPALSLPCGFADGLPLGLQVTGPLYEDLAVLAACRAYEEAAAESWPNPALRESLAQISAPAGEAVKAKIRALRG